MTSDAADLNVADQRLAAVIRQAVHRGPMPASTRKTLWASGSGLAAILVAGLGWTNATTAEVARHDDALKSLIGDASHPGIIDRLSALEREAAVNAATRQDELRRLASIEDKIDKLRPR